MKGNIHQESDAMLYHYLIMAGIGITVGFAIIGASVLYLISFVK